MHSPTDKTTIAGRLPSETVVEKVATSEGVDPTELVPLYGAIDPDALNRLVETPGKIDHGLQIEFTYHGYEVIVTSDGVVRLVGEDVVEG